MFGFTRRLFQFFLVGLLFGSLAPAPTQAQDSTNDWIVDQDATLAGEERTVLGNVTVRPGATLTLQGGTLYVGGALTVEPGATLVTRPGPAGPAKLRPADADGYYVSINGTLDMAGSPSLNVTGLAGDGMESPLRMTGGFQLHTDTIVEGLELRDSMSGLVVHTNATVEIRDSSFVNVTTVTIFVFGTLDIHNTTFRATWFSFMAKESYDAPERCRIHAHNLTMQSFITNFQLNGCRLDLEHSFLEQGGKSLYLANPGLIRVRDTVFKGYGNAAMHAERNGRIEARNVTFEPSRVSDNGVRLSVNGSALLQDMTIAGHRKNGVQVYNSQIEMHNVRLHSNKEFGLQGSGAQFVGDVTADNDFGRAADSTANGKAPLFNYQYVQAGLVDGAGTALPGLTVKVMDGQGRTVFEGTEQEKAVVTAYWESHAADANGVPVYQGPFSYVASHRVLDEPMSGSLSDDQTGLTLKTSGIHSHDPHDGLRWQAIVMPLLIGMAALLFLYGVAWDPIKKAINRRRTR